MWRKRRSTMQVKVIDLSFLDGPHITGLPLVDRKARPDPF